MALAVDTEIHRIIDHTYDHTREILKKYRSHLDLLAKALIEYETLTGDEVRQLIQDGSLEKFKTSKKQSPKDTNESEK